MTEEETFDELKHLIVHTEYATYYKDSNGAYHRDGGPAVIEKCGTMFWFQHGKLHRDDGPAVIGSLGQEYFWINGVKQYDD